MPGSVDAAVQRQRLRCAVAAGLPDCQARRRPDGLDIVCFRYNPGGRDDAALDASFDHNRIFQVLGYLVSNALKYTPRGGKITLIGERDDGGVRLPVGDTGSGIPEEALESVFERFTQVGANEHGGLGLVLHISRCLVQAHGGSIRAESKPGAGTRICLTLPANSSRTSSTAS